MMVMMLVFVVVEIQILAIKSKKNPFDPVVLIRLTIVVVIIT